MLEWRTSIFHKFLDITCVGHCCHFVMVVTQSEVQVHIRNQLFCAECRHVSVLTLTLFLATCFINGFYTVITIIMKNATLLLIVAVVCTVILLHFIEMLLMYVGSGATNVCSSQNLT